MKTNHLLVCVAAGMLATLTLNAAGSSETTKAPAANEATAKKSSAEFEQMKKLVGKWTGKVDIGQGPVDMTVQYRLLAAGSVLEERCFPDTPNEMVTMYYDQNGKLAMTHYCMFGNRPAMKLKSWDGKTIKFDFDATCGINTAKEAHMHALSITFNDADTITTSCVALIDGQEQPEHPTTMKRAKN